MPDSAAAEPSLTLRPWFIIGWLFLLLLSGFLLRQSGYGFSAEELAQIHIAEGDTLAQVLRYARFDGSAPLLPLLLHGWMQLSTRPPFLRLLPMFLGLGMILLGYATAKRMGGKPAALICATLIAFSYGSVIQSSVLRPYCLLLPCLLLNFLCYQAWREKRKAAFLATYMLTSTLAAVTHISAPPYFLALLLAETPGLIKNRPRQLPAWLLANLPALLVMFIGHSTPGATGSFWQALLVPIYGTFYLYPTLPLLPALLLYALLPTAARTPEQKHYLRLAGIACLVSVALCATHVYGGASGRESLWLLPCILPIASVMIAQAIEHERVKRKKLPLVAMTALLFLAISYDLIYRYKDAGEYNPVNRGLLQSLYFSVTRLGQSDLIVTDKDGLNLFLNPYRYETDAGFMAGGRALLAPYRNTHILISPRFFQVPDEDSLLATLEQAKEMGVLEGVDRIAFVKLPGRNMLSSMLNCTLQGRQVIYPVPDAPSWNFFPGDLGAVAAPAGDDFTVCFPKKKTP